MVWMARFYPELLGLNQVVKSATLLRELWGEPNRHHIWCAGGLLNFDHLVDVCTQDGYQKKVHLFQGRLSSYDAPISSMETTPTVFGGGAQWARRAVRQGRAGGQTGKLFFPLRLLGPKKFANLFSTRAVAARFTGLYH
jgi:hypothetical protein